ncbi:MULTISPECIES: hypothetical protein [Brevibacterium]|uniref:Uncharacterized protein n=1 Tax=Brevibacterium salitolerans TaxID=1403566 RepID=A0ABN2WBZ7_9MICO|nr:hypothetical protein [Brevibacterium sp.]
MQTEVLAAVEETVHVVHELPMPPLAFGLIAFASLMTLGVITLSWKGIAHRH